jgi:GrpB-like predicted nucleotidyltransferase (UPF0157 family)
VPRGTTLLTAYDVRWAEEYEREVSRLERLLSPLDPRVEHIGSTAVPGLLAKPLLDIALRFRNRADLESARATLQGVGYEDRGDSGPAGGVVLAKGPRQRRTHLLHLVETSDGQWIRWTTFRDALRRDPALRAAYAALKADLAKQFPQDRASYTAEKSRFIEKHFDARPPEVASN